MNATHHTAELLETLTATQTSFATWTEFKAAMQAGYVPTIRSRATMTNASRQTRVTEKAKAMLRSMVRAEGFKVFDGNATV